MNFQDFQLRAEILRAVDKAGFVEPSPVQQEAIPAILEGRDVVAQAHTGTGKTAAFGLPILNNLKINGEIEAVIIVPTRELAIQVSDEIFKFGRELGIKTATIYGGSSYKRQLDHIDHASIIVATPGRLLDLLQGNKVDAIKIIPNFVVLDEADEMLDMGFLQDIKEILSYLPAERQTLLFSATMPSEIKELADRFLKNPKRISITKDKMTNDNIVQSYYVVEDFERDDALIRLIDFKSPVKSIVFCRTKKEVDRLTSILTSQGFSARGLHGDIEQRDREMIIKDFKSGKAEVLIATDVASRGLDVSDVSHVFNYHIPFDTESYVHRIGRTGRAGRDGMAISIITPSELRGLQRIEKATGSKIVTKVVPNISKVKEVKMQKFVEKVTQQELTEDGNVLLNMLIANFSDESIVLKKLVSIIAEDYQINGSDVIGKDMNDISRLMKGSSRSFDDRGGDRRGGGRSFGGRDRGFGNRDRGFGNRDRSGDRGGERRERSFGERSERPERPAGDRPERRERSFGERSERPERPAGDRPERRERSFGERSERPERRERPAGERGERRERSFEGREDRRDNKRK